MELDVVEVAVSVGASVVVRLDLRRGKVDVHFLEFVGPVVHVLERLHYSVVLLLLVEHARLGRVGLSLRESLRYIEYAANIWAIKINYNTESCFETGLYVSCRAEK